MDAPDSRRRSKISLTGKVLTSSASRQLLPTLLAANALSAFALYVAKEWLLAYDVGVFWVLMRVLACGGLGVLAHQLWKGEAVADRPVEWSVAGVASLSLLLQQACLLIALLRLSPLRVLMFTHFASSWPKKLLNMRSTRQSLAIGLALLLSLASDADFSLAKYEQALIPYAALALHALATISLEHTQATLVPRLGHSNTMALTTLGAAVIGLPMYVVRKVLHNPAPSPVVPLLSLAAIPILACSLLFYTPRTAQHMSALAAPQRPFVLSFGSALLFGAVTGAGAFSLLPGWTDLFVAALLAYGLYPPPRNAAIPEPPRTPAARLARAYLKTILANPESRKIFYFLMLNMAYMGVQMLYGVWTNSLGLISDAIHMAFDCMAIGVGLLASVMATWPPNERFTYGYARIETLSGFANGIFLILISIFIIFEAIERLLEPPEMNTSQLLLVSSLGLGVNLFGMFAMGGHHHHGGGHSHSHGHSHAAPAAVEQKDHGHSHGGHEDHGHSHASHEDHGHSQSSHAHSPSSHGDVPFSPIRTRAASQPSRLAQTHLPDSRSSSPDEHEHEHGPVNGHSHSNGAESHSHSHDHSHSHGHDHDDCSDHDDHSHAHEDHSHSSHSHEDHSHSHSHEDHSHSHSHSTPAIKLDEPSLLSPASSRRPKRAFTGPSLQIDAAEDGNSLRPASASAHRPLRTPVSALSAASAASPITPSYRFGHDEHYETHHDGAHVPNLHDHSHAHDHHEGRSHNMRGVFLHVMADTLGSVGVIISTLLIQFYGWTGFDPIASLFIAILIAASVVPLVIDTGKILCLDVGDEEDGIRHALDELSSVHGLASYSAPRFWPKDSSSLIGSIHVQLAPAASSYDPTGPHSSVKAAYANVDRVVEQVDALLRRKISGLEELSIQVEGADRVARPMHL